MKKISLILVLSSLLSTVISQNQLKEIIVACGGLFEFAPPYTDRATIGTIDAQTLVYTPFDTIKVESIQDLVIVDDFAYLAAQDTIIKYDLLTYQRVAEVPFEGILSLQVIDNYVIAGRGYGIGDYVGVFDINLVTQIVSAAIVNTVHGASIIGDSLYVTYNIPGSTDNCPPWGCYDDTLGMLGVYDLTTNNYIHSIQLDTAGAGIRQVFSQGNDLFIVAEESGNVIHYTVTNGLVSAHHAGLTKGIQFMPNNNSILGKDATGLFEHYLWFPSQSSYRVTGTFADETFDEINDQYYVTTTDYSSFGKVFRYDANNMALDSIDVNISPEAIALHYQAPLLVDEKIERALQIYPNPVKDRFWIKGLQQNEVYSIIDVHGRVVKSGKATTGTYDTSINISHLPNGVYMFQSNDRVQQFAVTK